jgi:protein gp37
MAQDSKIEWTDHTFNPWTGCTKISPGCDHCYAEAWSKRSGHVKWGNHARKRTTEAYWKAPYVWQARSELFFAMHRRRQRVFCASLADVFDNKAPKEWRSDLFRVIRETPKLDWLLLTKRPQNIAKMLPTDWADGYANVWLGMTAEDQERYDQRWPFLSAIPAVVRFVSYEPAIGPLRLVDNATCPDWLISGGESGPGARLVGPEWIRTIIADCRRLGVKPFHKQWGSTKSNPLVSTGGVSEAEVQKIDPIGKGGSLVDGVMIQEFPTPRSNPASISSAA